MRDAPSVNYPVGRSSFAAALIAATWLGGGAALLGWAASAQPNAQAAAAVFAVWALCGASAAWWWRRSAQGLLGWDGAQWSYQGCTADTPRVALDLQRVMLIETYVRLRKPRVLWLWVSRNAASSDWDALRRAVYSRAITGAPQGATPPAAPS